MAEVCAADQSKIRSSYQTMDPTRGGNVLASEGGYKIYFLILLGCNKSSVRLFDFELN
jgi:hypothetical protein